MRVIRLILRVIAVLVVGVISVTALWMWQVTHQYPPASTEIVQLTPEKRVILERLSAESKFLPNHFRPFGYTGAANAEDRTKATDAVNEMIASILSRPDGALPAKVVTDLMGRVSNALFWLETEDRERAAGYMLEVWYILGFKGATGRFARGSGFEVPEGYGEPLPPGWASPDKPRPIGPPG